MPVLYAAMAEKTTLEWAKVVSEERVVGFGGYFGGVCFLEFFDSVIRNAVSEISQFARFYVKFVAVVQPCAILRRRVARFGRI